jgi:hypothetical protein
MGIVVSLLLVTTGAILGYKTEVSQTFGIILMIVGAVGLAVFFTPYRHDQDRRERLTP